MIKFKDLKVGDKILYLESSRDYNYTKEVVSIKSIEGGRLEVCFSQIEGYIFQSESYYFEHPRLGIMIPEQNRELITLFNRAFRKGQEDIIYRFKSLFEIEEN